MIIFWQKAPPGEMGAAAEDISKNMYDITIIPGLCLV